MTGNKLVPDVYNMPSNNEYSDDNYNKNILDAETTCNFIILNGVLYQHLHAYVLQPKSDNATGISVDMNAGKFPITLDFADNQVPQEYDGWMLYFLDKDLDRTSKSQIHGEKE